MFRTLAIILATSTLTFGSSVAVVADNWPPLCNGVSATPQHVSAGTPVRLRLELNQQALADLRKARPKFVLEFTWTAEAGKIIPAGVDATLETDGVPPGDYRIEASVSDGYGHTVACATMVKVDDTAALNATSLAHPHSCLNRTRLSCLGARDSLASPFDRLMLRDK